MTIKELKQNILLSIYHRYKDNKSTTIDLKDLCAQDKLIFDSPKQVLYAAKGLKDAGYISLILYIGDNGTITGITPAGIEYVEENLLSEEELMSDGLSDASKMIQSGVDVKIDVPGDESDAKNKQSRKESRKQVKYFTVQENYKKIVDTDATPCFGIDSVADCFAKQLDKIATSKAESTRMLGIFGPWGRGKTYFFNHLRMNLIDKQKHELEYTIVEFNAWKYQDTPALWAYLYETIYKSASRTARFLNYLFQTFLTRDVAIYFLVLIIGFIIGLIVSKCSNNVIRDFLISAKIPAFAIYGFTGIAYMLIKKPASVRQIIKKYTSRKSYKNYLGIQNEIEGNLQKLLQTMVLRHNKSRVILYVDDIDRCPSHKMISLIESLRTVLENRIIQERLIVICSIDEKKLLHSYVQELMANGFNSEESSRLSREQLDKLFLFGIKLARLDSKQLEEYLEILIKDSNSGNYKSNIQQKEVAPFSTSRLDGAIVATVASEDIPELDDEKIKNLFHDFLISHNSIEITPRKLRIMYYQVLFALSISAKGKGSFTDQLVESMLNKSIGLEYKEDISHAMSDIIEMSIPY